MRTLVPRVSNRMASTLVVLLWVGVVCFGMMRILDYQETHGHSAAAPPSWPRASGVQLSADRPTLLVFAHPRCSCTHATLSELERLLARTSGRLSAHLLLESPSDMSIDWAQSNLLRAARAICGLSVEIDSSANESALFGVATSGQVLLYDQGGRLLFAGGITPGRGHEGDNAGRDAIEALVVGRVAGPGTTPVFGCGLEAPEAPVAGREARR